MCWFSSVWAPYSKKQEEPKATREACSVNAGETFNPKPSIFNHFNSYCLHSLDSDADIFRMRLHKLPFAADLIPESPELRRGRRRRMSSGGHRTSQNR